MNNREHCRVVRLLLNQKPHPSLHAFMDDYSKTLGWGHRLLRHNSNMIEMARDAYGEEGALEVSLHIACDMGVVTNADIKHKRVLSKTNDPLPIPFKTKDSKTEGLEKGTL